MTEEVKFKKPIWKKWWFWVIAVFGIIILSLIISAVKENRNDVIFFLLAFLTFITLITGLIKPSLVIRWGERKTRRQVVLIYGMAAFIFLILSIVTTPPSEKTPQAQQKIERTITKKGEPSLTILEPQDNIEVILSKIIIKGRTDAGTKVTIQNKEVTVDENGNFKQIVELSIGKNSIQIIADDGEKQKRITLNIERRAVETPKELSYPEKLPNFLSFICSKPENSHTSFYYLIKSYCPTNKSFSLPEKITDVTVRLSTIQSKAGWDTNFLCSPETKFDLPSYQWQILTVGKDCGLGAKISPCDVDFISDDAGVTGIIIAPEIKSYTTKVMGEYCKKDALLKVTGKIVVTGTPTKASQKLQTKEEWKTIKIYQGVGSQELGFLVVSQKKFRLVMTWKNIPTDWWMEEWGIYECETTQEYRTCYLWLPPPRVDITNLTMENPKFYLAQPYLKIEVPASVSWVIEVQVQE